MPDNSTKEWCAGIPLVLERPFEAAEKQGLQREAERLRRRGVGVLLLFPALVAILILAGMRASASGSTVADGILAALFLVVVMVGLPVQILLARDAFRRSKGLFGDLRCGTVKRFAGPCGIEIRHDETFQRLKKAGLFPAGEGAEWNLEILPVSGRVWRVLDQPVRAWIRAQTVEIADTPDFASIAAQWLQPVAQTEARTLLGGARDMSPAEREELQRFARRLWLRPLPLAAGLTLWLSALLTYIAVENRVANVAIMARFLFLTVITVAADYHFATSLLLSRKMREDARLGRLTILRIDVTTPTDGSATESVESSDEAPTVELLPSSKWIWTLQEAPRRGVRRGCRKG